MSECEKGCLKCSNENNCLLCDPINFYIKKNGGCETVEQENCLIIKENGQCLKCLPSFYIDSTTKTCV